MRSGYAAATSAVMAQLYEVAEDGELPAEARGEGTTGYRMRPRHRVKAPRKKGERATDRGPHLHTLRRDNANGAWAKRRSDVAPGRWKPVDHLAVQAYDQYVMERMGLPHGLAGDFVPVSLFAAPLGAPMTADAITELLGRLSKRHGPTEPDSEGPCRRAQAITGR
ncbi:hypothetical protein [Embleya sp. NPDC001921]